MGEKDCLWLKAEAKLDSMRAVFLGKGCVLFRNSMYNMRLTSSGAIRSTVCSGKEIPANVTNESVEAN